MSLQIVLRVVINLGAGEFGDVQHEDGGGVAFGGAVRLADLADDLHRAFQTRLIDPDHKSGVLPAQESACAANFGDGIILRHQRLRESIHRIAVKDDGEN